MRGSVFAGNGPTGKCLTGKRPCGEMSAAKCLTGKLLRGNVRESSICGRFNFQNFLEESPWDSLLLGRGVDLTFRSQHVVKKYVIGTHWQKGPKLLMQKNDVFQLRQFTAAWRQEIFSPCALEFPI